jgi:hypothetical protein
MDPAPLLRNLCVGHARSYGFKFGLKPSMLEFMRNDREKRSFWYFAVAVGMAGAAVGVLAPATRARLFELGFGCAIVFVAALRLYFLRGGRRKRRRRV